MGRFTVGTKNSVRYSEVDVIERGPLGVVEL